MEDVNREELIKNPNISFIINGTRIKNGINTQQECVSIGVIKKKPKNELSDDEILPEFVDVVEQPYFKALHRTKRRPVVGGISGIIATGTACTIGVIVMDKSNNDALVALTNNHCAGHQYDSSHPPSSGLGSANTTGLPFIQHSPTDGGSNPSEKIGAVLRASKFKYGGQTNTTDAALISFDSINLAKWTIHNATTNPVTFASSAEYGVGDSVRKSGRTTYHTSHGQIADLNLAMNVDMGGGQIAAFTNQIAILSNDGVTKFSDGGDSGSVILKQFGSNFKVIGLLFAGGNTPSHGPLTAANHINTVALAMNIKAWDGSIVVAQNAAPNISVFGCNFERVGDTTRAITHSV